MSLLKKVAFTHPVNKNTFVDTVIDFINKQIKQLNNLSKYKTNLSKEDLEAVNKVKND